MTFVYSPDDVMLPVMTVTEQCVANVVYWLVAARSTCSSVSSSSAAESAALRRTAT